MTDFIILIVVLCVIFIPVILAKLEYGPTMADEIKEIRSNIRRDRNKAAVVEIMEEELFGSYEKLNEKFKEQ